MLRDITLPAFGSSVGEATVVQWLVAPGSEVDAGQVIAEIETDKAMGELEAPEAGVIEVIEVAEGSEGVETGTVLARLRVTGAETAEVNVDSSQTGRAESEVTGHSSALVGSAVTEHSATGTETKQNGGPHLQRPASEQSSRILASPYARKLGQERAIDLSVIPGSGPAGRVVSRDLKITQGVQAVSESNELETLGYEPDSYTLTPLTKMRRAIADGLLRSVREIPQYSLIVELEFDTVLEHRKSINAESRSDDGKVSVNDFILWACAQALKDVPAANSSWTHQGIAQHRHANIAVAVAIDEGLVAPVIHAAEHKTLKEIARASRDAINRTRDRQIKTTDLRGATFTVSNLGMMGIRSFSSILSQPQACILSVGAITARPVVRNGEIVIARLATCTLTSDHRVVDGAVGAIFLQKIGEYLRAPQG